MNRRQFIVTTALAMPAAELAFRHSPKPYSEWLFDVPRNKTKLEVVKECYTIQTHDSKVEDDPDFPRWCAVWMPPCWKMGYGAKEGMSIPELYSHVGRLIDEGEFSGYGRTEVDAVLEVCRLNNIPVVL